MVIILCTRYGDMSRKFTYATINNDKEEVAAEFCVIYICHICGGVKCIVSFVLSVVCFQRNCGYIS